MLGTLIDRRFELKELLGRSDLGALYLATDVGSGEMVAVKLFAEGIDLRGEEGLRYLRAVRRLAGFHHPRLLAPSEAGRSGTLAFQVTPYFPAEPLGTVMAGGALKLSEIVAVIQQVAEGLAALQRLGLAHGNLRPSNVLVSREGERIQAVACDPFLTGLRGTENALLQEALAPWRAPEEAPWLERAADGRTDLYTLGTLAYWMLTGRLPFAEAVPVEQLRRRLAAQPPPPREWNAVVPERLSAIVSRLLARNPDERPQSAEALLHELRDWAHPDPSRPGGTEEVLRPVPPLAGIARLPTAGREGTREAVLSALARARSGEGALLVLAGEAGSGRQTVIDSLRLPFEAAGALALYARTPREGWCGPFQLPIVLLQELLRRWVFLPDARRRDLLYGLHGRIGEHAALLTGLMPAMATLLPDAAPPAPMPAERQRLRMLSVLGEALLALADRERPLVLALSGLERADPDSLDWLRHLFHRLPGQPVLILATLATAPGWDETPAGAWLRSIERDPGLHWVSLPALSLPQTVQSVATCLGADSEGDRAPAREAAEWLHRHWGGHPLAQRLALDLVQQEQCLAWHEERPGEGSWRWNPAGPIARTPPETVSGLIEASLASLPEPLYHALELASLFPGAIGLEEAAALVPELPPEVLAERLESLVERGPLRRAVAGWRFAHDRLRDAVYRRIAPATRAAWHQAAGAQGESPRGGSGQPPPLLHLARLVRHFEQGDDLARAVSYGLAAAEEARHWHALHAACREYEALLASLRDDPRAGPLYAALGESRARLGHLEAAGAALAEALRRAPTAAHQADTLGMIGWVALAASRRDEALARAEEALRLLGEGLPTHAVGTALARLATGAATRYHQLLAAAAGTEPLIGPGEERLARLLELASLALGTQQPARAALADERILHLSAGRLPSPFTVRALIRLGAGDPSGDALAEAARLAEAHHLPHEAARVRLAQARHAWARLETAATRKGYREAGAAFRALGDLLGEAEALHAGLAVLAWQGPAPAIREGAQGLAALARLAGSTPLRRLAEGWVAYAEALEGLRRTAEAIAPILRAAEALAALGALEGASELWRLATELYLLTDQPHSAVTAAQQVPSGRGGSDELLLRAWLGEAHFAAALATSASGADPAPALREARRLSRTLATEARTQPLVQAITLRIEVLDALFDDDAPRALARAEEGEALLAEKELRIPQAWLAFRAAQGLKAAGHAQWLTWGGKALTLFDALGLHMPRMATRRLLELAEEPEAAAGLLDEGGAAAGRPEAGALRSWPEGLAALLEPIAAGESRPGGSATLPRELLRWLAGAMDAERAALFLADREGAAALAAILPAGEGTPGWVNRWLVDRVWAEGDSQLLEHYQPPAEGSASAWEAQSVLCLPFGGDRLPRGAIYLAGAVSRRVFGEADRLRAAELARQAGLLLGISRAIEGARAERDEARVEARHVRERAEWALAVSTLESGSEMLTAFLRDVGDPHGFAAAAAFRWVRARARLEPVDVVARFQAPLSPLEGTALPGTESARVAEAMERQQPVALRRNGEPAGHWESAQLEALAARRGLWLPLVARGESFGAVLLGAPDSGAAPGPSAWQALQGWLRAIAPAMQHAWERDALRAHAEAGQGRDALQEAMLAEAQRLLPKALRGWLAPDRPRAPLALVHQRGALALAGQVYGWDGLGVPDPAAGLAMLRDYFAQVEEALALHHARLERIGDGTWLARCEGGAESALWAAGAVIELVRRWQAESERRGARRLRTGLGLHLGEWADALAEMEQRREALVLGEAPALAKALAALNFRFHTDVLVSQAVLETLEDPARFELRPLGRLRTEPGPGRIRYHELYATRDRDTRERMTGRRALWITALQRYREGNWKEAEALLREYLAALPEDRPARLFLRACRRRLA